MGGLITEANPHYGDQRFALDMTLKRELGFIRSTCKEPLPGVPPPRIIPPRPERPASGSSKAPSCPGLRVESPHLYGAARPLTSASSTGSLALAGQAALGEIASCCSGTRRSSQRSSAASRLTASHRSQICSQVA